MPGEGLNPQARATLDAIRPSVKPTERFGVPDRQPMIMRRSSEPVRLSDSARRTLEQVRPNIPADAIEPSVFSEMPRTTNTHPQKPENQIIPPPTFTPEQQAALMEFHDNAVNLLKPTAKKPTIAQGIKKVAQGIRQSDIDFRNEVKEEATERLAEKIARRQVSLEEKLAREQIKARQEEAKRRLESRQNRIREQERQQKRQEDQARRATQEPTQPVLSRAREAFSRGIGAVRAELGKKQPVSPAEDILTRPPEEQPVHIPPETMVEVEAILTEIQNAGWGHPVKTEMLEGQLGELLQLPEGKRAEAASREREKYEPWQEEDRRILRTMEDYYQNPLSERLFAQTTPDLQQAAASLHDATQRLHDSAYSYDGQAHAQAAEELRSARSQFTNLLDREAGCLSQDEITRLQENLAQHQDNYDFSNSTGNPSSEIVYAFVQRNETAVALERAQGENSKKRVEFLQTAAEKAGLEFTKNISYSDGETFGLVEKPTQEQG